MMELNRKEIRVISESIKTHNLEEKPLHSSLIEGYNISFYRQKQSTNLWFTLTNRTGHTSGLILKREDETIWDFVGYDQIWFIFGIMPKETASTTFQSDGPVQITLNMTSGVFLATAPSPPIKLFFKDKNDAILQTIDIPEWPKRKWFAPIFDWVYSIPTHMPWYKSPAEVPLTRRWYD